jgi:hypothetical protein
MSFFFLFIHILYVDSRWYSLHNAAVKAWSNSQIISPAIIVVTYVVYVGLILLAALQKQYKISGSWLNMF